MFAAVLAAVLAAVSVRPAACENARVSAQYLRMIGGDGVEHAAHHRLIVRAEIGSFFKWLPFVGGGN